MAHRKVQSDAAHFDAGHSDAGHSDAANVAGTAHPHAGVLTRIQSALIFGSISSGLLACALGAFVYDIGRAVAAW